MGTTIISSSLPIIRVLNDTKQFYEETIGLFLDCCVQLSISSFHIIFTDFLSRLPNYLSHPLGGKLVASNSATIESSLSENIVNLSQLSSIISPLDHDLSKSASFIG